MADDQNHIEIGFAVTGADAAKAELTKVIDSAAGAPAKAAAGASQATTALDQTSEAAVEVGHSASRGFGGMLDEVKQTTKAIDQQTAALEKDAKAAEKVAAAPTQKKLGEVFTGKALTPADLPGTDATAKGVGTLIGMGQASMIAQLAPLLGNAGAAMRELATETRKTDATMGAWIGGAADGMQMLSKAGERAAQGFAVGGPWGAAIGGLVGLVESGLNVAVGNLDDELAKLEAENKAIHDSAVEAYNAKQKLKLLSIKSTIDAETTAINAQFTAFQKLLGLQAAHAQSGAATRQANAAVAGTANTDASRRSELEAKLAEDLRQVEATLAVANAKVATISNDIKVNDKALDDAIKAGGERSGTEAAAQIGEYRATQARLKEELKAANQDVAELPAQMAEHKQQIVAQYTTELAGVRDSIAEKMAAGTAALQAKLSETIAAEGESTATYQAKAARDIIAKAMADGFGPEDVKVLQDAFTRIKGTKEGQDALVKSMTDTLTEQGKSFVAAQNELAQSLAIANAAQEANTRALVNKINEHSARLDNITSNLR